MNPIDILKGFMGKARNPQQLVQKAMLMNNNNNPMISNLISMAQSGNSQGIEQFARNYCKERNIDFDKEFNSFMSNFK